MKLALWGFSAIALILFFTMIVQIYFFPSTTAPMVEKIIPLKLIGKCHLVKSKCIFFIDDKKVEVSLSGEIRTMKSFKLSAILNGFNVSDKVLNVDFSMKSMQMGRNNFKLVKYKNTAAKEYWSASILLPLCVSKRTDWLVTLAIIVDNKRYQLSIPLEIQ